MNYFTQEKLQKVNEFIEALKSQDDRSCVIMIAARLESLLKQAIAARLLEPRSNNKDSLEYLQYSKCVSLCFRLGLIHEVHANALDALGQIRNKVAHFDVPVALDNDEFRQFVKSFASPWYADQPSSDFHQMYQSEVTGSGTCGRALFVVTASIFFVFLSPLAHITNRLVPLPVIATVHSKRV